MRQRKIRPAAALAAVLALVLLAGCAGGKTPEPNQPLSPAPAQSRTAESTPGPGPGSAVSPESNPDNSGSNSEPGAESEPGQEPAGAQEPTSAPAPAQEPTPASRGPEDGNYTAQVTLAGGSGRASVQSPAALRCAGGQFWATVVWSSPNFDYMKVDSVRYELVSAPGENSAFEIPVAAFDTPLTVIADTVAMSEPHEVEYTLTFDSASLVKQ